MGNDLDIVLGFEESTAFSFNDYSFIYIAIEKYQVKLNTFKN